MVRILDPTRDRMGRYIPAAGGSVVTALHRAGAARSMLERVAQSWDRWVEPRFLPAVVAIFVFELLVDILSFGWSPLRWDLLLLSGLLTYIGAVHQAGQVAPMLRRTLERLSDRGIVTMDEHQRRRLEETADKWSYFGGPVAACLMLAAFTVAYGWPIPLSKAPLTLFEVIAGYEAGRHLGRLVFHGWLGRYMEAHDVVPRSRPGHIDGAAGLKPLGDLYFHQAMVAATPALFLAGWLIIFWLWPDHPYKHWSEPYAVLLAVALLIEVAAFVVPIWLFHRVMVKQKAEYAREADECSRQLTELEAALTGPLTEEIRKQHQETIAFKSKRFTDIEAMPTWPIDAALRRRFTLRSIGLATPLIGQLLTGNAIVQSWLAVVNDMLKSLPQ